ncbi:MAG TPA: molybdopterin converting factor subunit 1 [Planctomycetota bacterium]|nr:molybdopterin converting factor subunit 1 [Planctomycetota bacterium]
MLLFAGLAELAGQRELVVPVPAAVVTVEALLARLADVAPALAGRSFRVAVNRRYAQPADAVRAGDEVALIPPVSGG